MLGNAECRERELSMRMSARAWWLLVVLAVLLNIGLWQRPSISRWLANLALSRSAAGSSQADKLIQVSRKIWPTTPQTDLAAARIARQGGDVDAFAKYLLRAKYFGVEADRAEREQWLSIAQLGQMNLAGPKLAELVKEPGGDEAAITEAYALGYIRLRNYQNAVVLLDAWSSDFPKDARPWAWLGQIHADLQSNDQAESAFRKALELDPNNEVAQYGLGNLLFELRRHEEALPYLKSEKRDPRIAADAYVAHASCLRNLSKLEDAEAVLALAVQRFPTNYRVIAAQAEILVEQGKYKQAEELLHDIIARGTLRRELRYAYAVAQRGLGEADKAKEHFDYAAEAAKKVGEMNRLAIQSKDSEKTLDLRFKIGQTFMQYGNFEDGLIWLSSVIDLEPAHRPSHALLAQYFKDHVSEDPKYVYLAQKHAYLGSPMIQPHLPTTPKPN